MEGNGLGYGDFLVASLTFFRDTDRQHIDADATIEHLQRLKEGGADGAVILGTTGSGHELNDSLKLFLMHCVGDARARGEFGDPQEFPILTGLGACNEESVVHLIRGALAAKLSGALILPPQEGEDERFFRIAAEVASERANDFRIFLYHHPALDHRYAVMPATFHSLFADYPVIAGVKDSAGPNFRRWQLPGRPVPEDQRPLVAIGNDWLLAAGLNRVHSGRVVPFIISGTANTRRGLSIIKSISRSAKADRLEDARVHQEDLSDYLATLTTKNIREFREAVYAKRITD